MTESRGDWICKISGKVREVGDMCENNPIPKHKCRDCFHISFKITHKNYIKVLKED